MTNFSQIHCDLRVVLTSQNGSNQKLNKKWPRNAPYSRCQQHSQKVDFMPDLMQSRTFICISDSCSMLAFRPESLGNGPFLIHHSVQNSELRVFHKVGTAH